MKKILPIFVILLGISCNVLSQSLSSNILYDSSVRKNSSLSKKINRQTNVNASKMVTLSPDISFDEFPVNHNMHIATDGTYYYTINGGNSSIGQINKFDLNGVLLQTYPIMIDGRGLSYNKTDGFLYASLYARSIVRIDNLAAGTFTTIFTNAMQNDQASFAISPDGTKYYDFYLGTLLVHDFFTGTVINTITGLSYGPGNFGGDAAVAVDSLHIYTWDATVKTVSQYDLTGSLVQTLVLDSGENGHSISRAGNYLYVAHDGNYAMGRWYGYLIDSTNNISVVNTCYGDSTFFSLTNSGNLLGAQWDFGDTASGPNNVSYNINTMHIYTQPGSYTVTVIKYYTTYTDTSTLSLVISSQPVINLGADTTFCAGASYVLNAGGGYTSYTWQDGSSDSSFTATTDGTYYVTVLNGSCIATDSVILSTIPCNMPAANFYSSDTSFCDKKCLNFFDVSTNNPTSWQWFFPGSDSLTSNQQNPVGICYNAYGSYDVTLIACNVNGCDTIYMPGFINEYPLPAPVITQSNDTLYSTNALSYQWWNVSTGLIPGATNNYYVPTQTGDYYVIIVDSIGCSGASNVISVSFAGIADLTGDKKLMQVIPNPNNGNFVVSIDRSIKNYSLKLVNHAGQIIYSITPENGIDQYSLNLTGIAKGVYQLLLISADKTITQRLIIK